MKNSTKNVLRLSRMAVACALALGGAQAYAGAIISNGTVQMGVRDHGALNQPGGTPATASGTTIVGLRSVATGSDSTSPGCTCEGWGVGILGTGQFGQENSAVGGIQNLSLVSFTSTATSAVSIVNMTTGGAGGTPLLQVKHDYHPLASTPNLYEVTVSITNLTGATLADGQLLYRRVMDWDIPFPGSEHVDLQGVPALLGVANGNNVRRTDNNGFNAGNPFSFTSFGKMNINYLDDTGDVGALFDFEFEALADGATRSFNTYYGVAANRTEADLARSLVDGDPTDVEIGLYSYGVCSTGMPAPGCNVATGAPNTFIFGFGAGGGVLAPPDPGVVPEPGTLGLAGLALAALAALRRRKPAPAV